MIERGNDCYMLALQDRV